MLTVVCGMLNLYVFAGISLTKAWKELHFWPAVAYYTFWIFILGVVTTFAIGVFGRP